MRNRLVITLCAVVSLLAGAGLLTFWLVRSLAPAAALNYTPWPLSPEPYTQADLDEALALRTEGYEAQSVAAFDRALADWTNEAAFHAREERIRRLLCSYEEDGPEAEFVLGTLAAAMGACSARHYSGYCTQITPAYTDAAAYTRSEDVFGDSYVVYEASASYTIRYQMPDESMLTVGERDRILTSYRDAVQAFLKVPFTPAELGVDLLTISGHKIGAMKGSGALYLRKGLRAVPLIRGGGQERGLRSGTEATPQIAALAAAASLGRERMEEHTAALTDLKAYALETFQRGVPGLAVVSPGDAPHICAISLPGYPSQVVVRWLSDRGFCVSSGSACHRGKASHVYAAMHLSKGVRDGVLRISFGPENTRQEVDQLAQALLEATRDLVPARG